MLWNSDTQLNHKWRIDTLEGRTRMPDERLSEHDQRLKEHDQHLANQDAMLARMDDILASLQDMQADTKSALRSHALSCRGTDRGQIKGDSIEQVLLKLAHVDPSNQKSSLLTSKLIRLDYCLIIKVAYQ